MLNASQRHVSQVKKAVSINTKENIFLFSPTVYLFRAEMCVAEMWKVKRIGLYQPLDGITSPKYKLCSLTTNFLQREEGTSY